VVLARESGVPWWESGALAELACLNLRAGRVDDGEAHARDSLAIADRLHDRQGRVLGVGLLAWTAAVRGLEERAWLLWGAVADEDGIAPLGGWRRHRDTCEERIRAAVGRPFDPARVAASLSLEDAVALALTS
jgi:hypothetical protein